MTDVNSTPSDNSNGTDNWEERFKGLQREYNTLRAKATADATALESQRAQASQLQQQISALQAENKSVVSGYETQVTTLMSERDSLSSKLSASEALAEKLKTDVVKTQRMVSLQQVLSDEKYAEVKKLIDRKVITGLEELEGDALQTRLNELADVLGSEAPKVKEPAPEPTPKKGTTPPMPRPIAGEGDYRRMSAEQLRDWLVSPAGLSNPNFADASAYYAELLEPTTK